MLKNTSSSYGSLARFLHWSIALIVITLLCVGLTMGKIPDAAPYKMTVYMLHKSFGLLVLTLMIIRAIWACVNIKPHLNHIKAWERVLARASHMALYLFLFIMPLSGWIMSTAAQYAPNFFNLITLPFPGIPASKAISSAAFKVHAVFAYLLITVLLAHLAGAFKHHFIDKNNILLRMWSGRTQR